MKGLTMYQRQAPYLFPRRADTAISRALQLIIFPVIACLFILCGTPVQAQVSYSLDGDTEIRFERGQIRESDGFIHIFNASIFHENDAVMSADELKIQMRSSLDAEEQIIDSLYGVNLAFVVEEEEVEIKIRQIDATSIVLQTPTLDASASPAEIVRDITAEKPASIRIEQIEILMPEDGAQIEIASIEKRGAQDISQDATAVELSSEIEIKNLILSPYGDTENAGILAAELASIDRDDLQLDGVLKNGLIYQDNLFEAGFSLSLDVEELMEMQFALTGRSGHSVLALGQALSELDEEGRDDAELLGLVMANTGDIELTSAQLVLEDKGVLQWTDRQNLNAALSVMLSDFSPQLEQIAAPAITSFISQGGAVEITITPPRPANLLQLGSVFFAPDAAVHMLGLGVEHRP